MLSLDDIIGMCECTEEEIKAIALHEHVPDAIASELANYLIHMRDGAPKIRKIIIEDIQIAKVKGDHTRAEELRQVLLHFIATHPNYRRSTDKID
jgi:hypothetical protein